MMNDQLCEHSNFKGHCVWCLKSELSALRATVSALTAERDALAANSDAVHRAIGEMTGHPELATIYAVKAVIDERDALIVERNAARTNHDYAVEQCKSNTMYTTGLLQEINKLKVDLQAERDAAYRRGWSDARESAASVPVDFASYAENRDLSGGYSCREVEKAIRAMQPPTAHTEYYAKQNEFDGVKCACDCGCDRDADRYVDDLPSCEFCAKL